MLWPSDLALQALRKKPVGEPWRERRAAACSHCGKPINTGDPHTAVKVGEFFSDTRDLASDSGVVCGGCIVLRSKKYMNGLSFMVLTPRGLYPIAQNIHKAWLFLTPPEPPFIAVHSSATMQHLVWRTPVTQSNELVYLRRGSELFTFRPGVLKIVLELARTVQARRVAAGDEKAFLSPYIRLDVKKVLDMRHGRLSVKARAVMSPEECQYFYQLTAGEIWALGFLFSKNFPVPTQPEPVTIED